MPSCVVLCVVSCLSTEDQHDRVKHIHVAKYKTNVSAKRTDHKGSKLALVLFTNVQLLTHCT